MAEQSFKSPGFFEREIELISETEDVIGTPAGIIGASEYGPAFVPVTVGTFKDFQSRFGSLKAEYYAPYAVNEWLKNRNALTFLRVLGAGANSTAAHVTKTRDYGVVENAGFKVISQNKFFIVLRFLNIPRLFEMFSWSQYLYAIPENSKTKINNL